MVGPCYSSSPLHQLSSSDSRFSLRLSIAFESAYPLPAIDCGAITSTTSSAATSTSLDRTRLDSTNASPTTLRKCQVETEFIVKEMVLHLHLLLPQRPRAVVPFLGSRLRELLPSLLRSSIDRNLESARLHRRRPASPYRLHSPE